MMITWVNTIVQKNQTVAIATSLDEINFSAQITQRVYRSYKHEAIPYKYLCYTGLGVRHSKYLYPSA